MRWRLIVDPPRAGARNMALDEALARAPAGPTRPCSGSTAGTRRRCPSAATSRREGYPRRADGRLEGMAVGAAPDRRSGSAARPGGHVRGGGTLPGDGRRPGGLSGDQRGPRGCARHASVPRWRSPATRPARRSLSTPDRASGCPRRARSWPVRPGAAPQAGRLRTGSHRPEPPPARLDHSLGGPAPPRSRVGSRTIPAPRVPGGARRRGGSGGRGRRRRRGLPAALPRRLAGRRLHARGARAGSRADWIEVRRSAVDVAPLITLGPAPCVTGIR